MSETQTKTVASQPVVEVLTPSALAVQSELDAEVALTARAEESYIDRLSRMEQAAAFFERRAQLLEQCYTAAIRRTRPQDWVLTKDRQGAETAMLTISGADLIAEIYGISVFGIGPRNSKGEFEPAREPLPTNPEVYTLRAYCSAASTVNGRKFEIIEFSRRSDEEFTGRGIDAEGAITRKASDVVAALPSDLRSSVLTGIRTKAVRAIAGMTRVPVATLAHAWEGTDKKVEHCRRGHGYGTGQERDAKAVSGNLDESRAKLKDEIARRTGGNAAEARKLTLDITKNPEKRFAGFDTVDRIAQDWQLEKAWKALKVHPTYGDQNAPPAGEEQREPGED